MKKLLLVFGVLVGGGIYFEQKKKADAKSKSSAADAKAKAIKDQADANEKWKTNTLYNIKNFLTTDRGFKGDVGAQAVWFNAAIKMSDEELNNFNTFIFSYLKPGIKVKDKDFQPIIAILLNKYNLNKK